MSLRDGKKKKKDNYFQNTSDFLHITLCELEKETQPSSCVSPWLSHHYHTRNISDTRCMRFISTTSNSLWYYLGVLLLLLLLSRFSRVRLCATPETAAHQAPPSLGFSRQEHWSGLPFPSPIHESEKWKWNCSVVSDSSWTHSVWPHWWKPTRLLHPWDFPGKARVLEWSVIVFSNIMPHCTYFT